MLTEGGRGCIQEPATCGKASYTVAGRYTSVSRDIAIAHVAGNISTGDATVYSRNCVISIVKKT